MVAADVGVAILADAFVVRCASIGPTAPAPSRRRAKHCPSSVDVFAWPMDQYGLSNRCAGSSWEACNLVVAQLWSDAGSHALGYGNSWR